MRRALSIAIIGMLLSGIFIASAGAAAEKPHKLIYFFSPTCHRCAETREEVMPRVSRYFKDRVFVEYRDISDVDNYKMLFALKQQYGADEKSEFPVLYICGTFLDAREEKNLTYESVASFVARGIGCGGGEPAARATDADVVKYFHSLRPLAIATAGFVDGINPCAFTVIVFFMSFLFFQGYRRQSIAVVGLAFIVAVFITYVLLGLGVFSWLHAMKGYYLATKIISITIGVASIIFGLLSLYDAYIFKKKGKSEDMTLHLPKGIRQRIQRIIGDQYRVKDKTARESVLKLAGSALAVGFVISLFESVCTGQLYVPTIMFIMKTTTYKLGAFAYLILYNLMFTVPLLAIFGLALAGVSSQSFADVMKKNMFLIKIFLAAMFLFLGVSLVHADNSIAPKTMSREEFAKDPNCYDFGTVKEGDVLKHAFMLKNNETETITVKQVNTSCSCTSSKVDVKTVGPGQAVPIEIAFETKGYPGLRKRQLFVHTDSKKNPLVIFEIVADVK